MFFKTQEYLVTVQVKDRIVSMIMLYIPFENQTHAMPALLQKMFEIFKSVDNISLAWSLNICSLVYVMNGYLEMKGNTHTKIQYYMLCLSLKAQ